MKWGNLNRMDRVLPLRRGLGVTLAVLVSLSVGQEAFAVLTPRSTEGVENCRTAGEQLGGVEGEREVWALDHSTRPSPNLGGIQGLTQLGPAEIASLRIVARDCRLADLGQVFERAYESGRRQSWIEIVGYGPDGRFVGESGSFIGAHDSNDAVPEARIPELPENSPPPSSPVTGVSASGLDR